MNTVAEPARTANVTVKLEGHERDRLKSLAQARQRTPHFLMKEAISRYLDAEEADQAVLRIVDESVAHYEATGLHVTFDEFKDWTRRRATDPKAKAPECHT